MSFFSKIGGWFKKTFRSIFDRVKAFVQSDEVKDLFKEKLGQIAEQVVVELSQATYASLSNEDKRREAYKRIRDRAVESGLEFRDSIVNLLIELAIARLKAR